ncbi:thiol:disulfide interchange protein DsbA/DsbL [Nocardia sp. NPDC051570]|uniref:thiol:disulfide interchange protein DsbA/DsbL n=1 Tax=Nocardia sp. NPDC051570 TaxID=3364324 RepID=UPI003788B677
MAEEIREGVQYALLPRSMRVSPSDRIVVWEFFWYGSPQCCALESTLRPWVREQAADVRFGRVSALFGGPWDAHGQMHLTLDLMGLADDEMVDSVYKSIHGERRRLTTLDDQTTFLAQQGIDLDTYLTTFHSFAVRARLAQTKDRTHRVGMTNVPTLVVNGKYRTDLAMSGGPDALLQVLDVLVAKERDV